MKDRFLSMVDKLGPIPEHKPDLGHCWIWTGYHGRDGYGRAAFRGKAWKASRVSWTLHNGEIPLGLWVLHACDNRSCVNPSHLFIGNGKDNSLDMIKKGRHRAQSITHCREGHPYAGENLWVSKLGGRNCLICAKARVKRSLKNPEVAARSREYNREYHALNAEKIRERKRKASAEKRALTQKVK